MLRMVPYKRRIPGRTESSSAMTSTSEFSAEKEKSVSIDRLKPAYAKPDRPIQPAILPRRGRPPKQRDVRPAADEEDPAETSPAADEEDPAETRPEPEPEQRPHTYAQVTRRGRLVRTPERYIATTTNHLPATTA